MYVIVLCILLLLNISCEDDFFDGGPCDYYEIPGTASIISVIEADSSSCEKTVELLYNFIPDDPDQIDPRFLGNWPLDSIPYEINGHNFPKRWIETFGLFAGTDHRSSRFRITSGTCAPIYYEFEGINDYSVYDSCKVWYGGR
jgi:hypothetical protein